MECSWSAHSASVVARLPPAPLLPDPLTVELSEPLPTELLDTLPVIPAPPDPVEAAAPPDAPVEVVLGVEGLEQPSAVRKAARKKRDEVRFMISPVKGR